MKKIFFLLSLIGLFALNSCQSLKVVSDYDKEANFSDYKTYSFVEMDMKKTRINSLDQKRLVAAFNNEMSSKGLSEVASGGDLEVHMHGLVKTQVSATASTNYYGSGYPYYRRGFGWNYHSSGTTYASTAIDVRLSGAS